MDGTSRFGSAPANLTRSGKAHRISLPTRWCRRRDRTSRTQSCSRTLANCSAAWPAREIVSRRPCRWTTCPKTVGCFPQAARQRAKPPRRNDVAGIKSRKVFRTRHGCPADDPIRADTAFMAMSRERSDAAGSAMLSMVREMARPSIGQSPRGFGFPAVPDINIGALTAQRPPSLAACVQSGDTRARPSSPGSGTVALIRGSPRLCHGDHDARAAYLLSPERNQFCEHAASNGVEDAARTRPSGHG